MTGPAGGSRFLLTATVSRYTRSPDLDRPELAEDVARIAGLLAGGFGYVHLPVAGGGSPTQAQLRDELRAFCRAPERRPDDLVAVYLTCHGQILEPDDYVLLPSDIDPQDPLPLAVTPQDLVEWLLRGTMVQRLLLVLDTCYSGQGGQDAARAAMRWVNQPGAVRRAGVIVVTATRPWETAVPGGFSAAFERAVNNPASGGHAQEYLPLSAVTGVMNADTEKPASQTVSYAYLGMSDEPPPFLPNPRYRRLLVDVDLLEQERVRHAEQRTGQLRDRFLPATRWFTGRHAAIDDIAAWLRAPATSPPALVVTGSGGSGKTALLGLLAGLSDPEYRPTIPRDGLPAGLDMPEGVITEAIYAGTMTTSQIRDRIAGAAGVRGDTTSELIEALADRDTGQPLVVLIDALDEAADPPGVITGLLNPLLSQSAATPRLLLGTRPHLLTTPLLGKPDQGRYQPVDLDSPPYADPVSIRAYIRRILLTSDPLDSAYRPSGLYQAASPVLLDEITEAIGAAAGTSFLVARITAATEATGAVLPDPADRAWRDALPRHAGDAMRRDLRLRLGDDAELAAGLLLPLAYARGVGLPWENVWPSLVGALSPDRGYGNDELIWLRRAAGSYAVEGVADGRSVYRLYHRALAEYLLGDRDQHADEQAITQILISLVPPGGHRARDWAGAHPYIHGYLAAHAAAAGRIDELLEDPLYLVWAEPDGLLHALPAATTSRATEAARLLQRVGSRLPRRSVEERAAVLELGGRQLGFRWIADPLAQLPPGQRPWSVRWAHQLPLSQDRILGGHDGPVQAVAAGKRNGTTVAVSGGGDGMVRVWDLRTGVLELEWSHGEGGVETVVTGQLEDGPVVVSGGKDGKLRRWWLADGSPCGEPIDIGGHGKVTSAAVGDIAGRPFIVAAYEYGYTIRMWDLDTGESLGELEWDPDFPLSERLHGEVNAVAVGCCDGKPVIVAAHGDGAHKWVRTDGEWVAEWLISKSGTIWAIALGVLGERPVAVFGESLRLTTLDLGSGKRAIPSYDSPDGMVIGVAVGEVDGRTVAVSGHFFGTDAGILRVWDLTDQERPLWGSLVGHYGGSKALAITQLDGRTVLVSGGFDRSVRAWDLAASLSQMPDHIEQRYVAWLLACELGGRPVAVTKSFTSVSFSKDWVWRKKEDDERFARYQESPDPHDRSFLIGAASVVKPEPTEDSAEPVIQVWDLADGTPIDAPAADVAWLGDLCAVGHAGDAVLGVRVDDPARPARAGAREQNTCLQVLDVRTGAQVGQPIPINGEAPGGVAIGEFRDRPVVVFSAALPGDNELLKDKWLQVWDVCAGKLVWEPLPAYHEPGRGGPFVRAFGTLTGQPVAAVTALTRFGIWELPRGELIAEPPSMQRDYWLHAPAAIGELASHPVVVYSGYGRPIRVWDMPADQECKRAIEVDTEIRAITIAPDSTIIAAGPGGVIALRLEDTFFDPVLAPAERRTKAVDTEVRAFSVAGPADRAYLASVSPQAPRQEDQELYEELRRELGDIDEDELRCGYDRFGRLVVYGTRPGGFFDWSIRTIRYDGTTETLFAVGWPFLRMEYRPLWSGSDENIDDAAVIRGDPSPGDRAVYIFLPDGRIDLLPAEDHLSWTFSWGYGGSGPGRLEISICRAAGLLKGLHQSTYPAFKRWLEHLVEGQYHMDGPLEIPVGLVRAKFQQLKESSGK